MTISVKDKNILNNLGNYEPTLIGLTTGKPIQLGSAMTEASLAGVIKANYNVAKHGAGAMGTFRIDSLSPVLYDWFMLAVFVEVNTPLAGAPDPTKIALTLNLCTADATTKTSTLKTWNDITRFTTSGNVILGTELRGIDFRTTNSFKYFSVSLAASSGTPVLSAGDLTFNIGYGYLRPD